MSSHVAASVVLCLVLLGLFLILSGSQGPESGHSVPIGGVETNDADARPDPQTNSSESTESTAASQAEAEADVMSPKPLEAGQLLNLDASVDQSVAADAQSRFLAGDFGVEVDFGNVDQRVVLDIAERFFLVDRPLLLDVDTAAGTAQRVDALSVSGLFGDLPRRLWPRTLVAVESRYLGDGATAKALMVLTSSFVQKIVGAIASAGTPEPGRSYHVQLQQSASGVLNAQLVAVGELKGAQERVATQ